jgi:signal transduction histidine kinase
LLCDREGGIWFASNFGLARLIPEVDEAVEPPVAMLRSVRVDGIPLLTEELGRKEFPALELRPSQGNVEIEYSALHFRVGEKLRYQYRLGGTGTAWSAPSESQSAHFSRLTPGRYRFEVRAVNDAGVASPQNAAVSIRLLAPVWQRAWFEAAILLTVIFAAFALHRMRTAQLLRLERVRTRIATDLHDDIGASLSQMAILSEVIARRAVGGDPILVQANAVKIAAIARELVDSMSDIVWAINPAKERLSDLELRMREFAGEMLLPSNIALSFEAVTAGFETAVEMNTRREILLIFKEAIHNIVRHSGCTMVRVRLECRDDQLLLEVYDNGRGFCGEPQAGNGIGNMRRRAKNLGGTLELHFSDGEGVTLSVAAPLRSAGPA